MDGKVRLAKIADLKRRIGAQEGKTGPNGGPTNVVKLYRADLRELEAASPRGKSEPLPGNFDKTTEKIRLSGDENTSGRLENRRKTKIRLSGS